MGVTVQPRNFTGAAANNEQQNNMMKAINAIKMPGRMNNNTPGAKPQMGVLAQIPAFKQTTPNTPAAAANDNSISSIKDQKQTNPPTITESSCDESIGQ